MSRTLNTRGSTDPNVYIDAALTNVVVGAYASPADITGWNIINNDTAPVYIKFYDGSSGSITLGTTLPVKVLQVPAQTTLYLEHVEHNKASQYYCATGISVASVAGLADSNTTAPGTATYIEIFFNPS